MSEQKQSFLTRLVNPLTYPQKFLLITCLFGFSILITSFLMMKAQNSTINFINKELKGLEYEIPLKKLSKSFTQHFLLMQRYLYGEKQLKSEIISLQARMNSEFEALLQINLEWQNQFGVVPRNFSPETIVLKWDQLNRNSFVIKPIENSRQHLEIIEDLRLLIDYIEDVSNLNFDSEFISAYLIDNALARATDCRILATKVTSKAYAMIYEKNDSLANKFELITLTALLQGTIDQIKAGGEKISGNFNEKDTEQSFENRLHDSLHQFVNQVQEFINYVETEIIYAKELPIEAAVLLDLSQKSLEASYTFWIASKDELQIILESRLNSLKMQQKISVLITFMSAMAGCFLGFWIMRQISFPLINLVQAARRLSTGDLAARVPLISKDEVGEVGVAFNQMAESFQELIGQLQWTGIQLTTSTTEIAATAKQQEATIVEQEATTKQIAATAREISNSAKEFAKTMSEVSHMSEKTSSLATSGKAGLMTMETIMRQMVDAAGNIASKLAVLNEKAGSITSIITTISKVADQTNLLSLNAAIEAEKAGEYGRSFAVIAREIRRLADQTANALLDIEKMVNEMVSAVSAGVMGVDKFSEEINTGVNQVSNVGEQLTEIIEQVQQQTVGFETVNQGMQNQSLGAEQINDSITQLSEAAQQTTESIRQFHNAIEQLNNAAQEMQTAVSKIKR